MHRARTAALAAFALAVVPAALTAAHAAGQANPCANCIGPFTDSNPPRTYGYDYQQPNNPAFDAPQLFRFPALSNKSGKNCTTGPGQAQGRSKVVATFPAQGAVVRPGLVVVRVTFDQPMSCDASFDGQSDLPNPCPGRWREVTLSQDRRSFRTVCEVRPNTRYTLTLRSFRNTRGLAIPEDVTFSTSGSAPIATVKQALAEDVGGAAIG